LTDDCPNVNYQTEQTSKVVTAGGMEPNFSGGAAIGALWRPNDELKNIFSSTSVAAAEAA
jgi:hypothetical protein